MPDWEYFPEYRMNVDIINTFLGEIFPKVTVVDFQAQLSNGQFKFWIERPLTPDERDRLVGRRIRNRRR